MHFLATFWAIFLVFAFIFMAIGVIVQVWNMKKLANFDANGVFGRFAAVSIFMLIGSFLSVLTILGVIFAILGK